MTVPTSYSVKVDGPAIARPGSTDRCGTGSPSARHSCSTMARICSASVGGLGRVVLRGVRDAEAAAEVELAQADPGSEPAGVQAQHALGGDLEARRVEDLRADVGVQPDQVERRLGGDRPHRPRGLALGDREAELLVLVRGGDVLVRVRLDAGGHPQQHRLHDAAARGDRSQPLDLDVGVDDDPADTDLDRALELGDALVVAVEADPAGSKPAASATASSPPEQTSRLSPSSAIQRTLATVRNALPA